MKVLLDTHTLLWWRAEPERLSDYGRQLMQAADSELFWSAASTWELAIKASLGKLTFSESVVSFVTRAIAEEGLTPLEVTHQHAAGVESLPHHHRDPFDRLLISQAIHLDLPLLSTDPRMRPYPVTTLW